MQRSHLLTATFLACAFSAQAGLLGTDITLNYAFGGATSSDLVSVTGATEVECTGAGSGNANICGILTGPNQSIDFGDDYITYNYVRMFDVPAAFGDVSPNGFDFQNLNLGWTIVEVYLTTTIVGLDAGRLTFDANSIQLNMSNLPLTESETFTLRMVTNPEPSAGLLALAGGLLLGIGQIVRRRRR